MLSCSRAKRQFLEEPFNTKTYADVLMHAFFCFKWLILSLTLPTILWAESAEDFHAARVLLEQYVSVEKSIAQESNDWEEQRSFLQDRIVLLEQAIESLDKKILHFQGDLSRIQQQKLELQNNEQNLKKNAQQRLKTLVALEKQVLLVLPSLPRPLLQSLQAIVDRLPRNSQARQAQTLDQRLETILAFLQAVQTFDTAAHVFNEILSLNGQEVAVQTLYLGLSQAYFVGNKGSTAGLGRRTESAWQWITDKKWATPIATAIAAHQKQKSPRVVTLPVGD